MTVYVLHKVRLRDAVDPTKWKRDGRGNAVYKTQRTPIPGCSFQPSNTAEDEDDQRTEVRLDATLLAPTSFPGEAIDSVEVLNEKYLVVGEPRRWRHPRLGHVEVNLRKVSG